MDLALYYVLRRDESWIVRFGERDYGHETLTAAVTAAIAAARSSAQKGYEAQVMVQMPGGAWKVTWTSQEDFRPN